MVVHAETILPHDDPILVEHYGWALKLFPKAVFVRDEGKTVRFRQNRIFRYLCDQKRIDLNELAILVGYGTFNRREIMDLYMGLGYSLGGFEEIFSADLDDMERKGVTFDALQDERHLGNEEAREEDGEEVA